MKNTIKKYLRLGILFFGISLFLVNCSDDTVEFQEKPQSLDFQDDELYKQLLEAGYTKEAIEDKGTYFIVDHDLVFFKGKEYFHQDHDGDHTKQQRSNVRVTLRNISVWINPNMDANWRNASNAAIARWNNVNSGLTLTAVANAANADIQIMYDTQDPNLADLAPNVFGLGALPTQNGLVGLPGARSWVNPDFDFDDPFLCNRPMTQNDRIANVQHELGHNLGLRHTNSNDGVRIPGTPGNDPQSLMNGGQACTLTVFSPNDIAAIQFLYPVPFFITGTDVACRFDNVTFSVGGPAPIPAVATWTSSASLPITSSNGTSVTVNVPADSRAEGWIRADFVGGGSVTKNVWVGKPRPPASLSGPSSVLTGALVRYRAGVAQGATSYVWWLPYPFDVQNPIDYFSQKWQMTPTSHRSLTAMTGYGGNAGYVQVMGNNACGRGGVRKIYVTHSSNGGGGIP